MPREYIDYRNHLESIMAHFGRHKWLSQKDVAAYEGCSVPTAAKKFGVGGDGISMETLARIECQIERGAV